MWEINTICHSTGYQPLCIGDKQKMPLHRLRPDTADMYKTQVDDLPQGNFSAEMRTMICTLTRNKKLS